MQKVIVSKKQAGQRLDRFICNYLKRFSRSEIQKELETSNLAKVNGARQKLAYKISIGDIIEINKKLLTQIQKIEILAEDIPIKVLYENKDLVVIDKPAGLVVHPGVKNEKHTLVNALLSKYPKIYLARHDNTNISKLRPGIVHRLDKDTSGVIIVAKNKKTLKYLVEQLKQRKTKKSYQALVFGWTPNSGNSISKIARDKKNRTKMSEGIVGKTAITSYSASKYYQTLKSKEGITLLNLEIKTGRTHQIRVQFKNLGHPVLGDNIYNTKESVLLSKNCQIKRQLLHAKSIEFKSPDGEIIKVSSDMPKDFIDLIVNLEEIKQL
jgi:23S rRNA pseudouridine1911/1915/1917 synthase